ncbi:MAG: DNA polymerase thumb domain-containing protein [Oscillospiraceae bacterium]
MGALYSVGATASKLTVSQIRTIGDLVKTDLSRVQKLVGVKMGKLIRDYANGMDSSPVLAEPEASQRLR